jgi:cell shape-determining protein MreC
MPKLSEKDEKSLRRMVTFRENKIKELEEELKELRSKNFSVEKLEAENKLLKTQHREFKLMTEKAGSDLAKVKHDYLRMQEKVRKYEIQMDK